jgi:hypothetical protein
MELSQQGHFLNQNVSDNHLILNPFLISTFHGELVLVQLEILYEFSS